MKNLAILFIASLFFFSCEDPIELEIESGEKQVVVDAFLNNLSEKQVIKLQLSKDFFDEASQEVLTGATVKVTDSDGKTYNFSDINNNGEYVWDDSILVHLGKTYSLEINYGGQVYTSTSLANPVPPIDSLIFTFQEAILGATEGYFGQYFATDLPGQKDFYRSIVFINGVLDTRKNGIAGSIDGAFGAGNDGLLFIFPVTASINNRELPFAKGDVVKVNLMSINPEVYSFFSQVSGQINNGGLFAVPPSNVRTNIVSSSSETSKKAIGMFSVSLVSSIEKVAED